MPQLDTNTILETLQHGTISIQGEFTWGSNYTFLAEVSRKAEKLLSVYKPIRGEQPLWDFPPASLAYRETAAFLVSEALGWALVPPTVYRKHAPLGAGSLQLFIDHDPQVHYFSMGKDNRQRLRPVVLFDLLVNNADRKGSHLLFDENHHLWLIDHGICFHQEDKLRTVIWDFAGEPIPSDLLEDVRRFHQALCPGTRIYEELRKLLTQPEIDALSSRAAQLVALGHFPQPEPDQRSYPRPLM